MSGTGDAPSQPTERPPNWQPCGMHPHTEDCTRPPSLSDMCSLGGFLGLSQPLLGLTLVCWLCGAVCFHVVLPGRPVVCDSNLGHALPVSRCAHNLLCAHVANWRWAIAS